MSFEARHIDSALRSAEQAEILAAPSELFGEIRDLFSAERLEQGVQLEFFDDRQGFADFLETLQLSSRIKEDPGFQILNIAFSRRGATAYLGGAIDGLKNLQLVEMLEATHSAAWNVTKRPYTEQKAISPNVEVAGAYIDLGHIKDDGVIDTSGLGISLGLYCRYLPDGTRDDTQYEYLPELLDKSRDNNFKTSVQLGNFATKLASEDIGLLLPSKNYSVVIGPWVRGSVYHDPANRAAVKNGGLISRVPEHYL